MPELVPVVTPAVAVSNMFRDIDFKPVDHSETQTKRSGISALVCKNVRLVAQILCFHMISLSMCGSH